MASKMAADFTFCHILDLNLHTNVINESKYMFWENRNLISTVFQHYDTIFSDFFTYTYELICSVTYVLARSRLAKS